MTAALVITRVVAVLAACGAGFSAWRAASASSDAHHARTQAVAFSQQLSEFQRLQPQRQTALLASKPTESVSASLRAALATAGVGEASLRAVNPGSDEAVPTSDPTGPSYRRQTITVSIAPITARQLGQFLAAWRDAEPAWIVTRIDCSHANGEADTNSTYEARLTLATTYLATATAPKPTP
jgi:hypothetical protein